MRILLLTPQLPYPPDKGTRIRNWGFIKELARRHEVGVLSFAEPGDGAARADLARHCRVVELFETPRRGKVGRAVRAVVDPVPDLARRLESPAFAARLREVLAGGDWDILQVEALEMTPPWLAMVPGNVPPTVLDAHNAEWVLQLRAGRIDAGAGQAVGALYSALQTLKLRWYEGRAIARADAVVAVSESDAAALAQVGRPRRLAVVPNAVDAAALPLRAAEPTGDVALFTGTMDFRPNVDAVTWFVREVWPLVRAARPPATFRIVGRAPTAPVRALAKAPGVVVTGGVLDTAPEFKAAAVYVAPLRIGGGVRLKLLEAFAHGAAVVSTRLGAEGIAAVDGRDLVLADTPIELANGVVGLLADPARRRRLALAGRALVESRYDWPAVVPRLEALYEQLVDGRARSSVARV